MPQKHPQEQALPRPLRGLSYQHLLAPGQAGDSDDSKVVSLQSIVAVKDLQGLFAWARDKWVWVHGVEYWLETGQGMG